MDQLYDAEGLHWLPPGSPEGPWKPSTPLFRAAMDRIWAGGYADRAAYERDVAAATRAALDDSFRLFLVAMDRSAVLNAARFPRLPLTDRAAGIQSPWFWHSLEVAPEGEGRPLRAAVVSRAATVFQATWEPMVGWDLRMPISNPVVDAIVDHDVGIVDPATGKPAWFSQRLVEAKAAPPSAARSAGSAAPAGIAVPATALVWDGLRHAWKAAGSGMAAKARVVFDYGEGRWHDGRAGGAADALHFLAFVADWSVEDGPGDRRFDEAVRTGWARLLDKLVAVEPLSAARLAVYADWDWGADPERLASLAYRPTGMLPWTIAEALAAIVAESPEEGRRRAFVGDEQRASVDVLDPDCVKLIRERLLAFRAAGALPPQLAGLVSREEASAAWTAAIDFIDRHGHAFISNGPYLLDRVHFDPPAFELARNPGYPSGASEFRGARARFLARVEGLELPALAKSAGDLELGLAVSAIAYPEGSSKPAGAEARVGVALLSGAGELAKEAFPSGEGRFSVRFSPSELARLGTGVVKVIAEAAIGEGLPDFGTAELLLLP
jgi:peptide/nickel transport system substrate-binding protein